MSKKPNKSIKGKIALSEPEIPLWTAHVPKNLLDAIDEKRLSAGYNKRTMIIKVFEHYLGQPANG